MNAVCAMLAFLFAYSVLEPANVHIQLEPVTCCASAA